MSRSPKTRRRLVKLAALAVVAAFFFTGCFPSSTPDQKTAMSEMNADRTANGLRATAMNTMLQTKAQAWANKIAKDNTLSHSDLKAGISGCWRSLGENVGYGPSIAKIEDAYMASAHHRANILNSKFNYTGMGVAYNGTRIFTVQVFMQGC